MNLANKKTNLAGANFTYQWKKKGLIYGKNLNTQNPPYATLPLPVFIDEETVRIFFAGRNSDNCSSIYYVDFNVAEEKLISNVAKKSLDHGKPGFFDDHGVFPASCIDHNFYYIGWNPSSTSPLFYSSIGMATLSNDKKTLERKFLHPTLARSEYDPCLVTSPFVLKEGDTWRMWYVSGFKWEKTEGSHKSYYHIKYAESKDGIHWDRRGHVAIDFAHPGETNIARPWIIKNDNIDQAWFSYNCGKGYRIGYAESTDGGYTFERFDAQAGVSLSNKPWENETVCHPAVIRYKNKLYMFYNGNRFGYDGIALAVASLE